MDTKNSNLTHEQKINYFGSFPPIVQLVGIVVGIGLEIIFQTKIFPQDTARLVGIILIIISTIIIFWALKTSHNFRKNEKRGESRNFHKGPYRWSDNPTSFSLAILIVGFGTLVNSLMIVIMSALGYIVSYFLFEKKKQKLMLEKYSDDYKNYKDKLK